MASSREVISDRAVLTFQTWYGDTVFSLRFRYRWYGMASLSISKLWIRSMVPSKYFKSGNPELIHKRLGHLQETKLTDGSTEWPLLPRNHTFGRTCALDKLFCYLSPITF